MEKDYSTTGRLAAQAGVHPNTLRFYESEGLLTPPPRAANGRRRYARLHLLQCRLIRCAFRAEILHGGLRKMAVGAVKLCAAGQHEAALRCTAIYAAMLADEAANARGAAAAVERRLAAQPTCGQSRIEGRAKAARRMDITKDTLRCWERSGLISPVWQENRFIYSPEIMDRIAIVRTLRMAGYSLSAILRLLGRLDAGARGGVADVLSTPGEGEDIVSACDRLLAALDLAADDARRMTEIINEIISL